MTKGRRSYDSTVARIAGNIMSGMAGSVWNDSTPDENEDVLVAKWCVKMARYIVRETQLTEPSNLDNQQEDCDTT